MQQKIVKVNTGLFGNTDSIAVDIEIEIKKLNLKGFEVINIIPLSFISNLNASEYSLSEVVILYNRLPSVELSLEG